MVSRILTGSLGPVVVEYYPGALDGVPESSTVDCSRDLDSMWSKHYSVVLEVVGIATGVPRGRRRATY